MTDKLKPSDPTNEVKPVPLPPCFCGENTLDPACPRCFPSNQFPAATEVKAPSGEISHSELRAPASPPSPRPMVDELDAAIQKCNEGIAALEEAGKVPPELFRMVIGEAAPSPETSREPWVDLYRELRANLACSCVAKNEAPCPRCMVTFEEIKQALWQAAPPPLPSLTEPPPCGICSQSKADCDSRNKFAKKHGHEYFPAPPSPEATLPQQKAHFVRKGTPPIHHYDERCDNCNAEIDGWTGCDDCDGVFCGFCSRTHTCPDKSPANPSEGEISHTHKEGLHPEVAAIVESALERMDDGWPKPRKEGE